MKCVEVYRDITKEEGTNLRSREVHEMQQEGETYWHNRHIHTEEDKYTDEVTSFNSMREIKLQDKKPASGIKSKRYKIATR